MEKRSCFDIMLVDVQLQIAWAPLSHHCHGAVLPFAADFLSPVVPLVFVTGLWQRVADLLSPRCHVASLPARGGSLGGVAGGGSVGWVARCVARVGRWVGTGNPGEAQSSVPRLRYSGGSTIIST